MKMVILAIRDIRADVHGVPMFVPNIPAALRNLSDQVNTPGQDNMLYRHPEDFEVMEIGTFNDADASFELLSKPRQIATCRDMVKTQS